jgi:DnaJ-class molecular chaperone
MINGVAFKERIINAMTDEERTKDELSKCKDCHGTGYLKSYCDAPDRRCPSCNGSGRCE